MTEPVCSLLSTGEMEIEGRMPWSSNGTYLARVHSGDAWTRAVYKPRDHERMLHDFPPGLDKREVAAYELSEALGWDLIPQTVLREGPLGVGSLQIFVDADFEQHYFTLHEAGRHHDQMRAMCAFDVIANNTDRKSGHCLVSIGDKLFGIDHGLCFHEAFKLRTVIWEFAGQPIPPDLLDDIERLHRDGVPDSLAKLLSAPEREGLCSRMEELLLLERFPTDPTGRRYPWPLV